MFKLRLYISSKLMLVIFIYFPLNYSLTVTLLPGVFRPQVTDPFNLLMIDL